MELIYHYTTEQHLEKILTKGELIVSEWERNNKVKPPALWLSLNPIWENTATKLVNENGKIRQLTIDEQHKNFGLIRFVLDFNKDTLCSWAKYKHKSNTLIDVYEAMEQKGIKQGANPKEWFASFMNIPLSKCIVCEKWNGNEWIKYIDL
jgi:hypothetical protein